MIRLAIQSAKRCGRKIGICGQAPSDYPEFARFLVEEGIDSISPNRHRDIANVNELLDMIVRVRSVTGKPVGIKTAIGGRRFLHELCEAILRRGLETAPDFIAVDGGEGGSGAAPQALADHMALSIKHAAKTVFRVIPAEDSTNRNPFMPG